MWDWAKLLFIPILMPLVLVPAVTEWINAGISDADEADSDDADQTDEAHDADRPAPTTTNSAAFSPASYEIWLSPTEKITAEVRPPADPGDSPRLVVKEAVLVQRVMATTNQR